MKDEKVALVASPEILLAFGWYDHHFHGGVVRYAREHGWNIRSDFAQNSQSNLPLKWRGAGMILCSPSGNRVGVFDQLIKSSRTPAVLVESSQISSTAGELQIDNEAIVRLAAKHFLDNGFTHFMWVGDMPKELGNLVRKRWFVSVLQESGHDCEVCWLINSGKRNPRSDIGDALQRAPKPLALFAISDLVAVQIIHLCHDLGLSVPEDVAILGIGNDELYCESTSVSLSSVDSQQKHKGYLAAELLDRLMHGEPAPTEPLLVAPTGIVLRESTDLLASTHPKVREAISFMRGHGHERINVSEIAQHVGMSREGLRKAFVAHLHRAPGTVLRELRLKLAKNMLATTDLTLEAIALDSGFRDATRLCAVFRRDVGSTPAQFRRNAQE